METSGAIADILIRKLSARVRLSAEDRNALSEFPVRIRTVPALTYLSREGQRPQRCGIIVDGFAIRQKLTHNGEREIVALLVPGDILDLQHLWLTEADHDVQSLIRLTVAEYPIPALRDLVTAHPTIAQALWTESLIEASIHREWLLSIGRRSARVRLAHLLCEFQVRIGNVGGAVGAAYELPMTQEQLGDALGLTPVHINRVLKTLEIDGLIVRTKRQISVVDWDRMRDVAEFTERYLHLNQRKD